MTESPSPIELRFDSLSVRVFEARLEMGRAAAEEAAATIVRAIAQNGGARIAFAAAPSQNEFLEALGADARIDWSRITAFQLDEYVGLRDGAPESFGSYLHEHLFDHVRPGVKHLIGAAATLDQAERRAREYGALLAQEPLDLVCLGIGENGHLAFNDPPVADFDDPLPVKVVELDDACRRQQVNDGCFPAFDAVPTHAITLTIPALLGGRRLVCVVPGPAKRDAVAATLRGEISESCPASILRTHPACTLYLDRASYGE